jgi:hypothetical protein
MPGFQQLWILHEDSPQMHVGGFTTNQRIRTIQCEACDVALQQPCMDYEAWTPVTTNVGGFTT